MRSRDIDDLEVVVLTIVAARCPQAFADCAEVMR
jgi:hypothetical protein